MSSPTIAQTAWRQDATVMGLIGLAHSASHFSQLLLAPLFPWLKDSFAVSYAQLGFLLTIFFVVSCVVQAASGFWVDRYGPRPILFTGLALLAIAACTYSVSNSYGMLAAGSVLAGAGNGVFHPVNYTLLNRKIGKARLGHAYSVHGITGSLGWALAPLLLVPLTLAYSWRVALQGAALLIGLVLVVMWVNRDLLTLVPLHKRTPDVADRQAGEGVAGSLSAQRSTPAGSLDFLKIPAVWLCFVFFFFYAGALSIVQSFAPEAARQLHAVPTQVAALCLTFYMVCSAGGMVFGGFLASNPERCERIVGAAFGVAAALALVLAFADVAPGAVPVLFGAMGLFAGVAGPSRDLLVKQSAPDNATGRVYGVVYAGLDIGQAAVPMLIGVLMDRAAYSSVLLSLAVLQAVLIVSAFNVRRARRTGLATS